MTNQELLTILGNVRGEYILEAQKLRTGEAKTSIRKLSRKRIILIAAVISLLLLLVGCGAVLIGLQKIDMGKVTFPQYRHEGWTLDLVSINGYLDSPNYQATREWIDFQTVYDPDRSLQYNRDSIGYEPPEDYRIYGCYTSEMEEKVDEICEKYGLALAGRPHSYTDPETLYSAVGISSMVHPASESMFSFSGGSYFRSGSFNTVGMVSHRFEGRDTPDSLLFSYYCDRKTVFFPDYEIFDDIDSVDSWEYTAWDGTELVLAQNYSKGIITADVGDFFVSVSLDFCYVAAGGMEVDPHNPCSRTEFERIADKFAYQIAPREPDIPKGESESEWNYNDYMANWMPGSLGSDAYSPDYQQKLLDLDGDGIQEMLIWNARTGIIYEVVTMVNGVPQSLYSSGIYDVVGMYLCEGNILERECPDGSVQGKQLNEYYRVQDQQLVMVECVVWGEDGKWYWSESGGASSVMWTQITQEEYNAVLAKYPRQEDGLIQDEPIPEDRKAVLKGAAESKLLRVLMEQDTFYRHDDGMYRYLKEYCQSESGRMNCPVSITRYAFVDLDGDGIQEAIADFRFAGNEQVMCMVLRYEGGTVFGQEFSYRQMSNIKQDGTFAFSGSGDNDGWAKLRWDSSTNSWTQETVSTSFHDADAKKDVAWYPYPIVADVSKEDSFALFQTVFLPIAYGDQSATMDALYNLAETNGFYVYVPYENDFIIVMPGSKIYGSFQNGQICDLGYTLYLAPLEENADVYAFSVGVEQLNTASARFCIYRHNMDPMIVNSASDLAAYIDWNRAHPGDFYTSWDPNKVTH